jgi:hypothetical protein
MVRRTLLTMLSSLALTLVLGVALSGCGGGGDPAGDLTTKAEVLSGKSDEERAKLIEAGRGGYNPPGVRIPQKKQ